MADNATKKKIIVIPCSGIGKVHGLIAREVTYTLTDELAPNSADTMCLALIVSGDEDALSRMRRADCITVDGCPKLCAQKNVEMAGGKVAESVRVVDSFKNHRGAQPGTATALAEDGWTIVREIAESVSNNITLMCGCGVKADND